MGLKFNVDKYAAVNGDSRIKAAALDRRTPQYTEVLVRKKANNNIKKNKNLTLVNRKFLRLIAAK